MGVLSQESARAQHGRAGWCFVDCRFDLADPRAGRIAWKQATIEGARYADLDRDLSGPVVAGTTGRHPLPSPQVAANRFASWGLGPDSTIVAFDDRGGPFAARLWWMLLWLGHEPGRVHVLDGGLPRWSGPRAAGREGTVARGNFMAKTRPELLVDAEQVRRRGADVSLVDARTPERFRGEAEPIDVEAGHIPGAHNAPWPQNLDNGSFASVDRLRARFAPLLGEDASEAILYCGSGVTACHNLLAIDHGGLGLARLYAGSWSEWITDAGRARALGD